MDPIIPTCYNEFKSPLEGVPIDEKFVYPFYYSPTQLGLLAAEELKEFLSQQKDWVHDFGIDTSNNELGIGKMFGVLVVKNKEGNIGYLSAFSGKLAGKNHLPHFVPPVFDMLEEDGFFLKEIEQLNEFNRKIKLLETNATYVTLLKQQEQLLSDSDIALTKASPVNLFFSLSPITSFTLFTSLLQ